MSKTDTSDMVSVIGKQIMVEGVSTETGRPYKFYNTWVVDLDKNTEHITLWSKFKHKDVLKPTEYTNKAGELKTRYDLAPDQALCKEAFDHLTSYVTVDWSKDTAT